MTKKILLALALTLGTATFAAPPASACGGYGSIDPRTRAVSDAISAFVRRQEPDAGAYVYDVRFDAERATARFTWMSANGESRVDEARLRLRDGAWRIVAVRAAA